MKIIVDGDKFKDQNGNLLGKANSAHVAKKIAEFFKLGKIKVTKNSVLQKENIAMREINSKLREELSACRKKVRRLQRKLK